MALVYCAVAIPERDIIADDALSALLDCSYRSDKSTVFISCTDSHWKQLMER